MRSRVNIYLVAVLALAVASMTAGCGSDNSSSSGGYGSAGSSATAATTQQPAASAAVVSVASVPKLGRLIVDSKGLTLYDFHKDKGGKPSCYGACAKVWPPLTTTGKPRAGEGAIAAKLGVVKRTDGTIQVTYAGHPLYTYEADTKPGDAKGNDVDAFGAEWYALQPSGEEAEG